MGLVLELVSVLVMSMSLHYLYINFAGVENMKDLALE